jgi:ABC-type amino acid transport substrate-binding protein
MSRAIATWVGRLAVLALALSVADVAPAADASPLRVGITPNYPPLAFKENGELKGIEVDFAHRLGTALKREIVLVETPWEDLIKALVDEKTIDVVMSGVTITEKRKAKVDFTDPYLHVGQMILIRGSDYPRVRSVKDLNKPTMRIGYTNKTTSAHYAHDYLHHALLRGFPDSDAAIAALRDNQIDAVIADAPIVWRVTGGFGSKETQLRGLYTPLTHEALAWAVRKNDHKLRAELNAVIKEWKHDGTLEEVIDHWITVKKRSIEVKPEQ